MAYLVLAYLEIAREDYNLIQDFRKQNDKLYYSVVKPHFTIVFPVFDINENDFITEIINLSNEITAFDFEIKCATINKDSFSDYYHLLLVPDNGYSSIVKLHDKLYGEKLFKELRLDIDFIPHIAIANSKDKIVIKKMADEWNMKDFSIKGTFNKLTIVEYSDNLVLDLKEIQLKE